MTAKTNCDHEKKYLGGCEMCLLLAYDRGDRLQAQVERLELRLKCNCPSPCNAPGCLLKALEASRLQNIVMRKTLQDIASWPRPITDDEPTVDTLIDKAKAALVEKTKPDPLVACHVCGTLRLCPCGHPVAMHRPKCFWRGLCSCAVEVAAEIYMPAVEMERKVAESKS